MFLIILGASLTLGTALLAVVSFTEGALVTSRTAAQVIGWLFVIAALVGLAGLRRARRGETCAVGVTLCSGLVVLYMSYFFEWNALPHAPIGHAAAEALSAQTVAYKVIGPVVRPAEVQEPAKAPAPRRTLVAVALPVSPMADACSALTGVESLQCDRCSDKAAFAWMACQERVRLEYCDSEVGDERTCPSPIPSSHPG
jgi:hypothetical protein